MELELISKKYWENQGTVYIFGSVKTLVIGEGVKYNDYAIKYAVHIDENGVIVDSVKDLISFRTKMNEEELETVLNFIKRGR